MGSWKIMFREAGLAKRERNTEIIKVTTYSDFMDNE